jgi:hypothetical protein
MVFMSVDCFIPTPLACRLWWAQHRDALSYNLINLISHRFPNTSVPLSSAKPGLLIADRLLNIQMTVQSDRKNGASDGKAAAYQVRARDTFASWLRVCSTRTPEVFG